MKIAMKNPKTGEIKEIKVGWSWTLFLFSGVLGIPLFLRKLHIWGGIFLALSIVNLMGPELMSSDDAALGLSIIFGIIFFGLQIFMGLKGNEMTAKNYLENNWVFVNPESDITKMAKMRWGIAAP
ncbi:hypothetical protein [Bordetella trematum]|uniref:hypothetical protein n=1 Tax=Bordetella trematum TaxID=123899 RepID=UPI003AF38431